MKPYEMRRNALTDESTIPESDALAAIETARLEERESVRTWHPRCETCRHYDNEDSATEWCYKPGGHGPTTHDRYCSDHEPEPPTGDEND